MEKNMIPEPNLPSRNEFYNDLRRDPANMSHWLPAILPKEGETRELRIPKTAIVQASDDVCTSFFMEREGDMDRILAFVREKLLPAAKSAGLYPQFFMKNGGFSDKFRFDLCVPGPCDLKIAANLIDINYDALCFSADGFTEVCLRELIPYDRSATACIYSGLPLRPEFRVFYDFTAHRPLYAANYWDWDYCHERILANATDGLAYNAAYAGILAKYEAMKDSVMEKVARDMADVEGLQGPWSVDVMLCEEEGPHEGLWLIDMAPGPRSAYWDPAKAGQTKGE